MVRRISWLTSISPRRASAIELGFPHDFLAAEPVRQLVHGGTFGRLVL